MTTPPPPLHLSTLHPRPLGLYAPPSNDGGQSVLAAIRQQQVQQETNTASASGSTWGGASSQEQGEAAEGGEGKPATWAVSFVTSEGAAANVQIVADSAAAAKEAWEGLSLREVQGRVFPDLGSVHLTTIVRTG